MALTLKEETRKLLAYCHWVPITERVSRERTVSRFTPKALERIDEIANGYTGKSEYKGNGGGK